MLSLDTFKTAKMRLIYKTGHIGVNPVGFGGRESILGWVMGSQGVVEGPGKTLKRIFNRKDVRKRLFMRKIC